MDPDATRTELRELADTVLGLLDATDRDPAPGSTGHADLSQEFTNLLIDASRLAELAQALDGWISGGGYLPSAWAASRGSDERPVRSGGRPGWR